MACKNIGIGIGQDCPCDGVSNICRLFLAARQPELNGLAQAHFDLDVDDILPPDDLHDYLEVTQGNWRLVNNLLVPSADSRIVYVGPETANQQVIRLDKCKGSSGDVLNIFLKWASASNYLRFRISYKSNHAEISIHKITAGSETELGEPQYAYDILPDTQHQFFAYYLTEMRGQNQLEFGFEDYDDPELPTDLQGRGIAPNNNNSWAGWLTASPSHGNGFWWAAFGEPNAPPTDDKSYFWHQLDSTASYTGTRFALGAETASDISIGWVDWEGHLNDPRTLVEVKDNQQNVIGERDVTIPCVYTGHCSHWKHTDPASPIIDNDGWLITSGELRGSAGKTLIFQNDFPTESQQSLRISGHGSQTGDAVHLLYDYVDATKYKGIKHTIDQFNATRSAQWYYVDGGSPVVVAEHQLDADTTANSYDFVMQICFDGSLGESVPAIVTSRGGGPGAAENFVPPLTPGAAPFPLPTTLLQFAESPPHVDDGAIPFGGRRWGIKTDDSNTGTITLEIADASHFLFGCQDCIEHQGEYPQLCVNGHRAKQYELTISGHSLLGDDDDINGTYLFEQSSADSIGWYRVDGNDLHALHVGANYGQASLPDGNTANGFPGISVWIGYRSWFDQYHNVPFTFKSIWHYDQLSFPYYSGDSVDCRDLDITETHSLGSTWRLRSL